MTNNLTESVSASAPVCLDCARARVVEVELSRAMRQQDAELDAVISEREQYFELLEQMTAAVAAVTYRDFGEHSSTNDPWRNAIAALKGLEA